MAATELAIVGGAPLALDQPPVRHSEPPRPPIEEMVRVAELLARSGYYKDVKDASQAFAKMMRGWELGLGYATSLSEIHIVEGKPELSSVLMARKVKESGKYDYRVRLLDDTGCRIEWFEYRESVGFTEFTAEDAKRAQLSGKRNYQAYGQDMYFARALSRGAKRFCADAFGGTVYAHGELEPDYPKPLPRAAVSEDVPAQPRAIAEHNGVTADAQTGEVVPPKAARPAVNTEKAALIAEVKSLITLAAADENIKLGKAETPGIKALVASCRAQGCHPTAMLLDGLSPKTLTQARDEIAAALAEVPAVEEAAAELDEQMDTAIAGDTDPFAATDE